MLLRRIGYVVGGIGLAACGGTPDERSPNPEDAVETDPTAAHAPIVAQEPDVEPPRHAPEGLPPSLKEIHCGDIEHVNSDGEVFTTPELYYPDAMTRKLTRYPQLRQAAALSDIRTCADARAFMQTYRSLLEQHPEVFGEHTRPEAPAVDTRPESEDRPSASNPELEAATGIRNVEQSIKNGTATNQFATVFVSSATTGQWCSGVAISKFHTLTSAHCTLGANGWIRGSIWRQSCTGGSCVWIPTLYEEMWLYLSRHPDFTGVGDYADDLAVLTIYHIYDDGSVTFPNPAAGNAMRVWLGSLSANQAVDVYGYGPVDTLGGGSYTLRRGSMNLAAVNAGWFWAWVGNQSTCQGDSGGPAVVAVDKVAGLASAQSSAAACPPDGWVTWNRLAPKMSWLEGQMNYPFGSGYQCSRFGSGTSLYARCW